MDISAFGFQGCKFADRIPADRISHENVNEDNMNIVHKSQLSQLFTNHKWQMREGRASSRPRTGRSPSLPFMRTGRSPSLPFVRFVVVVICAMTAAWPSFANKPGNVAKTSVVAEFSRAGYWDAEGSPRRVETLTTGWEFSLDGFKTSKRVALPHGIDEGELGIEASGCVNRQQQAWYKRKFKWTSVGSRVPRDRAHQFIHFEAIMGKSRVTLNGKVVAEHFGGYLPIHAEVTGTLKEGENLLEVWCDNSDDPSYPPGKAQDVLDFTYFGGIYRDAYLIETGEAYVADTDKGGVWITSNLGKDGKWTVRAEVTLGGDVKDANVELFYDGETEVGKLKVGGDSDYGVFAATFSPESPALWTPETPNLHWLRVDVKKGGRLTDRVNVRFGIRDFKMTMDGLILNGKTYERKLIGANRHQDYAFIGNALPNSLHWRDVKKFKDCGMTIFRCAHYPQDPAFMDACDEMGMFVIVATPGWQFWNKKNPLFEKRVYDDIEKMVRRDRSRPSLFLWEPILNETHFPGRFTTNAVATVKRNALPPNDVCACDRQSEGSGICEVSYQHGAQSDRVAFRREWGDYVDNWVAQNSISRVPMEWGEGPMAYQAKHYMWMLREMLSRDVNNLGGCLWHGTDHARGYHPDNFFGGIMTYARQKKYSYYAFKAALTKEPMVFLAHELAAYSPDEVTVFSNCAYKATLCGKPFEPGATRFDRNRSRAAGRAKRDKPNFEAVLSDGTRYGAHIARRLTKISMSLDTEGLAPEATGGDLVAVVATLSDDWETPKRYSTETIRFTVDGEADIVGTNPQVTRWGEAVVLVRPCASSAPKPITIRAATLRKGKYAPAAGAITFTPGSANVRRSVSSSADGKDDAKLRAVGRQQREFE